MLFNIYNKNKNTTYKMYKKSVITLSNFVDITI
jgi:hypothetical protein